MPKFVDWAFDNQGYWENNNTFEKSRKDIFYDIADDLEKLGL